MLTISTDTTKRAFECYVEHYASEDSRAWSIEHQMRLYASAARAFTGQGSFEDFCSVYEPLRKWWKVFRNGQGAWDAETTFRALSECSSSLRLRRLSEMAKEDWARAWECLQRMKNIKRLKSGSVSLVAVSKFLHFWNPRLFVICDVEVVKGYALRHTWIGRYFPTAEDACSMSGLDVDFSQGLGWYLRLLMFAARLVKTNPHINETFASTARKHAGAQAVPDDIASYEAAAVEWCILGLVELPPAGVTLGNEGEKPT